MKIIEKEIKYQLNEKDFLIFKEYLNNNSLKKLNTFKQVNYYIDTKDLSISRKGITARIRKIFNKKEICEFTIKVPYDNPNDKNIKIKREFSIPIDEEVTEDIIHEKNFNKYKHLFTDIIEQTIKTDIFDKVYIVGELETIREFYLVDEELDPINIDESLYLGRKDYEIEWESDKVYKVKAILNEILNKLNITPINNNESKKCEIL